MPTYEYECDACHHRFDEFQSFKDDPLKTCPKCQQDRLRRLFGTGAAILFKGSGFYETDYRSEGYQKAAKADADAGKPADKPSGDKKDAAPAPAAKPADSKPSSSDPK
jgi:putative FmdB family regulatory protein